MQLNAAIHAPPAAARRVFSTLCLFFGLLRMSVIEELGMDPTEYYSSSALGDYATFGWSCQSDPRNGTPVFVSPRGLVTSLVSPKCAVGALMRAAIRAKDSNPSQLFCEFLL